MKTALPNIALTRSRVLFECPQVFWRDAAAYTGLGITYAWLSNCTPDWDEQIFQLLLEEIPKRRYLQELGLADNTFVCTPGGRFLLLGKILNQLDNDPDLRWATDLCSMCDAFRNLALDRYRDLGYQIPDSVTRPMEEVDGVDPTTSRFLC